MNQTRDNQVQTGRLVGKIAIVTGGGSGIGKASAILLAKEGARVGILERDKHRCESVQKEIEALGGEAFAWETDVSQAQSVESGIANVAAHYGGLDVVFANAGINGVLTSIESMSVEDWSQTVDINLKGTFLTVKYAIPYLKEKGGSIIITSSINGNRVFSNFGFSAYSTTKAGQVAFMKMAALELAQFRIRVNAICPGAIHTNINASTEKEPEVAEIRIPVVFPEGDQPLEKGPGSAEQVASLVAFLASKDSSHITGTEIYIDGAESLIHG
jgi:NAD(P)-dependent dehydrogenase (short-subunit alcohol dehydrogenase family)